MRRLSEARPQLQPRGRYQSRGSSRHYVPLSAAEEIELFSRHARSGGLGPAPASLDLVQIIVDGVLGQVEQLGNPINGIANEERPFRFEMSDDTNFSSWVRSEMGLPVAGRGPCTRASSTSSTVSFRPGQRRTPAALGLSLPEDSAGPKFGGDFWRSSEGDHSRVAVIVGAILLGMTLVLNVLRSASSVFVSADVRPRRHII